MSCHVGVFVGATIVFWATSLVGQTPGPPQEIATRIIDAARANTGVIEITQYLSDWIGPRLAGSEQEQKAIQWTAERMRADGLSHIRLQPVMVPRWVRGVETGELLSPSNQRLPLTALGGSVATPLEGITAEVVEITSFDQLSDDVKGKIVYYHTPLDPSLEPMNAYGNVIRFRSRGAVEAARFGAVAALIRSTGTRSLGAPHTGSMYYADDAPRIPNAAVNMESGDLLHRLIAAGEKPRARIVLTPRSEGEVESANVIGELPGTDRPDEIVVIGTHLDSWDLGSAAVDNAAGCAISMEVPKLLKELGLIPRRTIRVVLFTAEEIGNLGGEHYADMPKEELSAHVAALEGDQGPDHPFGFRVSRGDLIAGTNPVLDSGDPGLETARATLERWARVLEPVGASRVDVGGIQGMGADISPLARKGVLGVALRTDQSRYMTLHHTDADTFDKIRPDAVRMNLAALALMTYALANAPESFYEGLRPDDSSSER